MDWNADADALFRRIVANVPVPYRALVEGSLWKGAEAQGAQTPARAVSVASVVRGFFAVTPEPFHSEVRANLASLGVDYESFLQTGEGAAPPTVDLSRLLEDLKGMSAVAEVPFDEAKTWTVLSAYASYFQSSPVAMRTTTKPKERRDLSVRYLDMVRKHDPDPLTTALAHGFVADDGHPIFSLYAEAKERCGAFGYGVDLNVRSGFSKIWMAPSVGMAVLDTVASLKSLPRGAQNTVDHFARFGLSVFGLFGFDFVHHTTNLYFMIKDPANPRDYAALLADLGYRPDLPEALRACGPAQVLYYSFSWEGERAERVCFAVVCSDKTQVPPSLHPLVDTCLGSSVFMHDQPRCIYSVVWSPTGHYFKIDNDYRGTMALDLVSAGRVGV